MKGAFTTYSYRERQLRAWATQAILALALLLSLLFVWYRVHAAQPVFVRTVTSKREIAMLGGYCGGLPAPMVSAADAVDIYTLRSTGNAYDEYRFVRDGREIGSVIRPHTPANER